MYGCIIGEGGMFLKFQQKGGQFLVSITSSCRLSSFYLEANV